MESIKITVPSIPQLTINPPGSGSGGTTDHAQLTNLEFEKSGHIGFQKELTAEQLANINGAITKDNTKEYTPTEDYHPATKKYVDEAVEELIPDAVTDPSGALILTNNTQVETSATVGAVSADNYGIYIGSIEETPVPDIFESVWHILPCEEPFIVGIGSGMTILFFGDDCSEAGEFTPQANTHYEISFKRLGTDDSSNPLIIARVGAWQ